MPKKGDKVMIYQRTISCERPEGEATLIYLQDPNKGVCNGWVVQLWLVQFTGDVRQYSRSVLTDIPAGME